MTISLVRDPVVLVVDDDAIARMALMHLLARVAAVAGTVEASDGDDAWRMLSDGLRPALVCCDIVMPNLSGLELLGRTRASLLFDQTPFVMISSTSDRAAVEQAIAGGAQGFIVKPYTAAVVARTVTKVLDSTQSLAERPSDTCRRLGVESASLKVLTNKLADDADQLLSRLAGDTGGASLQVELRKLHGGALLLGLSRCGELLRKAVDPNATTSDVDAIVREVRRLIERRCLALSA